MNSEHMNHHGITDVISFSYLTEYDLSPDPGVFGEVFICIEKAKSESEERNISFTDELTLYIVHGILHIASYDDMDPSSRKRMRLAEAYCMNNLKKQFSLSEIFALKNPNKQC
jgi:probable rRNA maturation factor